MDVKVLAFSGSLRKKSFNRALLDAAVELAPATMTIERFDLAPLPFYSADVEAEGDPEPVRRFKEAIRAADGLLIATPEYNFGIPGVLKNALDWASRRPGESPLSKKPVGVVGATSGLWGTARAQMMLRQVLLHNACRTMPGPEVLIARARERFDDDGRLVDEKTREFFARHLEELAGWIRLVGAKESESE
jgi:chromate reductase, NAD(P)H dehydrogenase (quinone)